MARTVGRNVFTQGVKILSAAFVITFDAAFDARENFAELGVRFNGRIYESLGLQSQPARFLQKTERKSSDDAESILHVQPAAQKSDGNTLFGALLAWSVGEKYRSFEERRSGRVLGKDGFDAQCERWQRQFLIVQFDGRTHGLSGKDVLGEIDFEIDTGQRDGRENSGHQDDRNEARKNKEKKIVAGV